MVLSTECASGPVIRKHGYVGVQQGKSFYIQRKDQSALQTMKRLKGFKNDL